MIVPSAEQIARGIEMSYEVLSVFERMHDEDSADIAAAWAEAKRQTQDAIQSVLDTLSQELERLRKENQMLSTRVDSQRLLETTGSTASTERR